MASSPARSTRSTGAKRNVRALPAGDKPTGVTLNLDTYEREGARPEPFVIVVGGRRIEMSDPAEMDWQDLVDVNDPFAVAETFMSEEDAEYFLEFRMPAHKLQAFSRAFQQHYGLGSPGNAGA
jgi:hypothetical protein